MRVKPHIKFEQSILFKRQMWFCRGLGRMGMGDSISDAYLSWCYFMEDEE